jgi:hypothetical protein
MAQVIPPEMNEVLGLRSHFRAAGVRATFSADVMATIDRIRSDIPSSEDRDGWMKVGSSGGGGGSVGGSSGGAGKTGYGGSGGGGGGSSGAGSYKSRDAFRGINTNSQQKPASNIGSYRPKGNIASERPRFTSSRPVVASGGSSTSAPHHSHASGGRYTSRFKNKDQSLESTIVHTIILSKLNKFSPSNYNEVKDFLNEILASGETDFLTDFMHLIFTKAAAEEIYCPLYAQLLAELADKYPFLITEMMNIYHKFIDIFEEVSEEQCKDTEEFIKKNKEKKYRKGYSQFVTELYNKKILNKDAFMMSLVKIAEKMSIYAKQADHVQLVEEFSASFLRICKAVRGDSICVDVSALVVDVLAPLIDPVNVKSTEYPSLTKKIQFAVLDARDAVRVA